MMEWSSFLLNAIIIQPFDLNNNKMSDKDIQYLKELAIVRLEEAKRMTKAQAIHPLSDAGILTTKGEFKKNTNPYRR